MKFVFANHITFKFWGVFVYGGAAVMRDNFMLWWAPKLILSFQELIELCDCPYGLLHARQRTGVRDHDMIKFYH